MINFRQILVNSAIAVFLAGATLPANAVKLNKPPMANEYFSILTTYAIHAKSIWVDQELGGYWGDGIAAKNANGAVRGSASTMLTYAMLAHAWEADWLEDQTKSALTDAGLNPKKLREPAIANMRYLLAHHKSAPEPREPQWGYGWQPSLWLGSLGPAALLMWDHLTEDDRKALTRVAGSESDRLGKAKTKSYARGDTGAEENAWNTAAPAIALASAPDDPRADQWWQTLCRYAVNTYTIPADQHRTDKVGAHVVGEIVETETLFSDYTLDNHGFFHPDYVQVSGQHLGEAWQILALGDQIHGTNRAEQFRPYSLFNLEAVWRAVMRNLVLPSGELLFPAGNDWTYHCTTNQSYFAFISHVLKDPVAAAAERQGITHVLKRRDLSPDHRILGDSNMEWWWEPLVCKRSITAMLHHMLRDEPAPEPDFDAVANLETTAYFPNSNLWMHRTSDYVVSVSWAKKTLATFMPVGDRQREHPYSILPVSGGFLPGQLEGFTSGTAAGRIAFAAWTVKDTTATCAIIALPRSVIALSTAPFGPVGIENDSLTTPGRTVVSGSQETFVPAVAPAPEITTQQNWAAIKNIGVFLTDAKLKYFAAGKWNFRSVAIDHLQPRAAAGVLQMVPWATAGDASDMVQQFKKTEDNSVIKARVQDGPDGEEYELELRYRNDTPQVTITKKDRL